MVGKNLSIDGAKDFGRNEGHFLSTIADWLMANLWKSVAVSLASMAATAVMAAVSGCLTYMIGGKCSRVDKLVLFWLIWDAMIHFLIEGPFVVLSLTGTVAESDHFMAELWKEYGKADRRWLVSDPTIVSLEVLTVLLDGPMCVWLVWAVNRRHYSRHWVQITLCVCELYGGWMTFAPDWLVGSPNLVTDNPLYLWVYLVFFNGLWVVIPILLLVQSWSALRLAFSPSPSPTRQAAPQRHGKKSKRN